MRNLKWYYLLAIALGLGAIIAIVYVVVRSGGVMERLSSREVEQIEA